MRHLSLLLLLLPALAFAQSVPTDGSTHTFENISEIRASYTYQLVVEPGKASTVRIEAPEKIRDLLRASVRGRRLTLSMDPELTFSPKEYGDVEVRVYVTVRSLRKIELSGAVRADVRELDEAGEVNVELSGAAQLEISGRADEADLRLSGAAKMDGKEFAVNRCKAVLSGAARADIRATESIRGAVSGAGSLNYTGQPREQNVDVSGAGSVRGN